MESSSIFFDLLNVALGHCENLQRTPYAQEWNDVFELAKRQSLIGVCFSGIERLPVEQRPDKQLLLSWYALVRQIEVRNAAVSRYAVELCGRLRDRGFEVCVLKGQGVAAYYPNPLRRQSGDIDVWVRTADGDAETDRQKVIDYVRSVMPNAKARYHHIEFDEREDIPVELHFMPTWINNPFADSKLKAWFEEQRNAQFRNKEDGLCSPTPLFNAIYLLLHIQKHILEEGIGLRQLMDYYFLLVSHDLSESKQEIQTLLKRFGMMRTAGAVMYVLQKVFGLCKERLLCESDEELGRFLTEEIMLAGNFGKYDPRFGDLKDETAAHVFFRKQKRALRFLQMNPSEVLWSPLFAVYQRVWRYRNGLI